MNHRHTDLGIYLPVARPNPSTRLSPREAAAIEHARARVKARKSRFALHEERKEDKLSLGPEHSDLEGYGKRLLDAFGTSSIDFAETEARRLSKGLGQSNSAPADIKVLNAALAVVDGIQPENEVEAMLASQMAITHALTMQAMMRAHWAEYQPKYQIAGNLAIKLSRTFTMQMEALSKLRRGGEQTVRVEHVHIHNGGQAIVGNINHPGGSGVSTGNQNQPHAPIDSQALAFAPGSPVWSEDASRDAIPVASGERKTCCRMHGGAKGSGAPKGRENGNYKHGQFTCKAIETRREIRALTAEMQARAESILQT